MDEWKLVHQLQTWNGSASTERFGSKVALDEDGDRLVIASEGHSSFTGKVQLYEYSGSSWSTKGSAITGDANNDYFGASIDLSDDGNHLVVGAWEQGTTKEVMLKYTIGVVEAGRNTIKQSQVNPQKTRMGSSHKPKRGKSLYGCTQ